MKTLTRRDFMRLSALTGGGLVLGFMVGCTPEEMTGTLIVNVSATNTLNTLEATVGSTAVPTTALDVTTQAQLLKLMNDMVQKFGTSLVLVTHNLGLVARYAQRIYVMYARSRRRFRRL